MISVITTAAVSDGAISTALPLRSAGSASAPAPWADSPIVPGRQRQSSSAAVSNHQARCAPCSIMGRLRTEELGNGIGQRAERLFVTDGAQGGDDDLAGVPRVVEGVVLPGAQAARPAGEQDDHVLGGVREAVAG